MEEIIPLLPGTLVSFGLIYFLYKFIKDKGPY